MRFQVRVRSLILTPPAKVGQKELACLSGQRQILKLRIVALVIWVISGQRVGLQGNGWSRGAECRLLAQLFTAPVGVPRDWAGLRLVGNQGSLGFHRIRELPKLQFTFAQTITITQTHTYTYIASQLTVAARCHARYYRGPLGWADSAISTTDKRPTIEQHLLQSCQAIRAFIHSFIYLFLWSIQLDIN